MNKGRSLNERGKKEKDKYDILQKEKHDKKEKEEKVTAIENYTESNIEKKYVALESKKNNTANRKRETKLERK